MSSDQLARVYGCAWCHRGDPVPNGLPYYRYAEVNGSSVVLPADRGRWARTHGICPAHPRVVEGEINLAVLARFPAPDG